MNHPMNNTPVNLLGKNDRHCDLINANTDSATDPFEFPLPPETFFPPDADAPQPFGTLTVECDLHLHL